MTQRSVRNFVFLTLFVIALTVNTIPPLMTTIQETLGMSVGQSSVVPLSMTFGAMFATFGGGALIAAFGLKKTLLLSLSFSTLGCLFAALARHNILFLISVFLIGAGNGGTVISTTTIFAHLDRSLQKYGIYHAFFGVGGIIAPLFVAFFLQRQLEYRYIFGLYFGMLLLIWIYFIIRYKKNKKYTPINLSEALKIIKRKYVYVVLLVILLYAGIERGTIVWSSNLFTDLFDYSKEGASFIISGFWIAFTIGRVASDYFNDRIGQIRTFFVAGFASLFSLIMLLVTGSFWFFILAAFSYGPVFPSLQKFMNQKLDNREVGLLNGITFGSTGIGIISFSYIMGITGDHSLYLSYMIPIGGFVALLLISSRIRQYRFEK